MDETHNTTESVDCSARSEQAIPHVSLNQGRVYAGFDIWDDLKQELGLGSTFSLFSVAQSAQIYIKE